MSKMKQSVMVDPHEIVIQEVENPEPADNEVLVAIQRIGLCGSDIHV